MEFSDRLSQVYLGIDLGAESGRVMAGHWDGRTMRLEEIHRFPNGAITVDGTLRWDIRRLWSEIERGLTLAATRFGNRIVSIGVDTWALDYVLLDKAGELIELPFNYRDPRTRGLVVEACQRVGRPEIFAASGLQFMEINTLYQLMAHQRSAPKSLASADRLLMIPDYLNYRLCGAKAAEFTNATTTQFLHPVSGKWSMDLLEKLGIPTHFLPEIVAPGSVLGRLSDAVKAATGLGDIPVIAPAAHDTGSAVVGVPTDRTGRANWAYLSSGTWSLLGVEVPKAILTSRTLELNLTNEGGVDGTYRLLKNIMGLWLVQQCKRSFDARGKSLDYPALVQLAREAEPLRSLIDPDDARFLNPADMPSAIHDYCRETHQPIPETEGALIRCALESLALKYRRVLGWIEEVTGEPVEVIHIVGGGSRNTLLNEFTATACGRPVVAGPVEATILGNLMMQVRAQGGVKSLSEIRSAIRRSGDVVEVLPGDSRPWEKAWARFLQLPKS
ncbi:MAG TPA: rhamnulokinase [Roseimicrobium sp.]|nr:rhamnulokinase [Roseimicrobium sp.]